MIDVDTFSGEQNQLLSGIVSDLGGPTSIGILLRILESTLNELKPDWQSDPRFVTDGSLKTDLEVCIAALQYMKVKEAAEGGSRYL
jgi:hypothetical protein